MNYLQAHNRHGLTRSRRTWAIVAVVVLMIVFMLVIVRGIFLKGVGLDILWPQFAALLALGVGVMGFAVGRFHKTLA